MKRVCECGNKIEEKWSIKHVLHGLFIVFVICTSLLGSFAIYNYIAVGVFDDVDRLVIFPYI